MRINLTDGYWITADNYNYILEQDYVVRKGKTCGNITTRIVGYYSNGINGFKGCIKRYLEECSLDNEKSAELSVKDFCDHLEKTINFSTDWIVGHIGDLVQKTYEDEMEMKSMRDKHGDD